MSDKVFLNEQIFSKIKKIKTKKMFSHAYIVESKDETETNEFLQFFLKSVVCEEFGNENHKDENCKKCRDINKNNYLEVEYVEPDGLHIKIEQIRSIQKKVVKKAVHGDEKIYIIKNAERLGNKSSNALLKLVEEPENNIFCVLLTDNYYSLISTIRSRCQRIKLNSNNEIDQSNEEYKTAQEIVRILEEEDGILKNGKMLDKKNKEEIINIFENIINIYKSKLEDTREKKYINLIKKMIEYRKQIFNNANIILLFDKIVIETGVNMDG